MKKALILLAGITIFTGCKKSSDDAVTGTSLTVSKDNIAGTYKITGESTSYGSASTDTYTSSYLTCERDDTHVFTAAGNYTFTDAGTQCSPSNGTSTSAYTLTGSTISLSGFTNATIEALTTTTMKISTSYNAGGATYKIVTTFTRQ